ncbi:MAG: LPS export ABC transporter permease LptF [Moraxella sp.]|nr:LPS export ABC transporter permease LptF [Moraxella sp.]
MILRRYITHQVAITTALVLGFLVVMLLGGRLIRYFGMAAEGGLQLSVLFSLIGYNLPYFLELILPLSFFVALMLVFGRLYADSEMAVFNASGVSRGKLARLLIPLVLVLFVFEGCLTIIAKPWGVREAQNIWQNQSLVQIFDLIRPRQFVSSGNYHLYVGEVGDNREYLKDVIVVQSDTHSQVAASALPSLPSGQLTKLKKDTVIFASTATQVARDDNVLQLDLHQGRRYEVNPATREYNQVGFERYRISLDITPTIDSQPAKIETWRFSELIATHSLAAQAELGYRMSLPWLILLAPILALPLSYTRPRQGRWAKLVPSVFVFVACALIIISLKNPIEKGKVGVWIYPAVLVMFFGMALYANYHGRVMTRFRLGDNAKGGAV